MEPQKYLVLFFNGDMISKCKFFGCMASRSIPFEYTGEYLRFTISKERLLLEMEQCEIEDILSNASFGIEEVYTAYKMEIRTISDLKPFNA